MTRFIVALAALAMTACTTAPTPQGEASSDALNVYDLRTPFGMHGPTYNHQFGTDEVWDNAQGIFDGFHELGMDYARMDIWWSLVEPERGRFEWDYFDRAMETYANNDIKLMVILNYGPAWNNGHAPITDDDLAAWAVYVENVVTRYGDQVQEWEVWNEPNILPFWAPRPDVDDYARLLKITYETIKRVDPDAVVLGGATAGPDWEFLEGIFAAGAGECFDVLTYHAYGQVPSRDNVRQEVEGLRRVLEANGRGDVPIWLSEHGLFTGPGGVDEETQAREIVRMFVWRVAEGVERSVYLSLRDWYSSDDAAEARDFWGLTTLSGEHKPSFAAVQTMLANIEGRPHAGEIHLGDGIEAYLFGTPDDNRMVMWAMEHDVTKEVSLRTNNTPQGVLLGEFEMNLTPNPVWYENVGPGLALLAQVETSNPTLAQGGCDSMIISVTNPFEVPITVMASGQLSEVFEVAMVMGGRLDLAPGETGTLVRPVCVADDAPVGDIGIPITMNIVGLSDDIEQAIHHAKVTVSEPFTVEALPMPSLSASGNLPMRFLLTNHMERPLEITAGVSLHEENLMMRDITLDESEEIAFDLPLDLMLHSGEAAIAVTFQGQGHIVTMDDSLRVFAVPHVSDSAQEIVADGDLSEWESLTPTLAPREFTEVDFNPNRTEGASDLNMTAWLAWEDRALHMALRVEDDTLLRPIDHMIWNYDGLQIAFDTRNNAMPEQAFDYDDIEIEIGLLRDGSVKIFPGKFPAGRIEEIVERETLVGIQEVEGAIQYEITFPAEVLDPMVFEAGSCVGFNFIHNDNDGDGREGWGELSEGIGWGKIPSAYPTLVLMAPASP